MSENKPSVAKQCPVCRQPAELTCSSCKLTAYCSKEHQKVHWKEHKNGCKPYEIKSSPTLGRYLVASRDIPPDTVIVTEAPLIYGPRLHPTTNRTIPCAGCFALLYSGDPPGRCLGCGWPSCGTNCPGLKDTKGHATDCVVLRLRASFAVNDIADFYRNDAVLPLRFLLMQKMNPKIYKQLLEMESHQKDRKSGTEIYEDIDKRIIQYLLDNYIRPIKAYETEKKIKILDECSSSLIHRICGIIDVNALEIQLDNGGEILALYATTCLVEHNCMPNTYHTFETSSPDKLYRITLKSGREIKKGEHISTTYTHSLWGTIARREHLKETKYFDCCCERCSDPTELETYLSALKCLGTEVTPCDGSQLPIDPLKIDSAWKCNKCDLQLDAEEVRYLSAQINVEVEEILQGTKKPTVKELEKILDKLLTFLHPHHYHVYSIKHSLLQLYGYEDGYLPHQLSDEVLKKKSTMCRELLSVTKILDPNNIRLTLYTGVLLHELHLAIFQLVQRRWPGGATREVLDNCLDECHRLLAYAEIVLLRERPGTPGHRLRELIDKSHRQMKDWMRQKGIVLG